MYAAAYRKNICMMTCVVIVLSLFMKHALLVLCGQGIRRKDARKTGEICKTQLCRGTRWAAHSLQTVANTNTDKGVNHDQSQTHRTARALRSRHPGRGGGRTGSALLHTVRREHEQWRDPGSVARRHRPPWQSALATHQPAAGWQRQHRDT